MRKVIKSALLAGVATVAIGLSACGERSNSMKDNPFNEPSTLAYGAPDFSKIENKHYIPAFEEGIRKQREEIQAIIDNSDAPTFDNTIVALEKSGALLSRVRNVFFALAGAHATKEIEQIEAEVIPQLTAWENEIIFNQPLFDKIEAVYQNELNDLQGEDKRLLEETYKSFANAGAALSEEQKAELGKINERLAVLQQTFGKQLPEAANAATVWIDDEAELAGLTPAQLAQAKADAQSRGAKAPYAIVITNTTQQPILASLDVRATREKVYLASIHRADETSDFNTYPLILEMAQLRQKQAEILGYPNYAAYSVSDAMAKKPEAVTHFLTSLIKAYRPKADAETKEIEQYARQTQGSDFMLQPYDRFYYSAKMKAERFNFNEAEVMPYFEVKRVLENGVFYAANRVFGLTVEERYDIPVYHKDVTVYTVRDKDGSDLAIFYFDPYRRETKRGGAWMGEFAKQSHLNNQKPLIYNVCNFAKAPEGQPSLITWDEVTTLFHEFGHALHGILSDAKYNRLSGTDVPRDFVEFPSQFNEFFASVPEIFANYAIHYETGEAMPEDLREKMMASVSFHSAYALGENLASSSTDFAFHMLESADQLNSENVTQFQSNTLERLSLLDPQIPPRYNTSYFNHVWGGGYAAGYYSYLWSEVLAVNTVALFEREGALNPAIGDKYRKLILSKGNTEDLAQLFTQFTGLAEPDATGLLKARGLE